MSSFPTRTMSLMFPVLRPLKHLPRLGGPPVDLSSYRYHELRHNGVLGSPYRIGASASTTHLPARGRSYARTASYNISKNRSREASSTTSTFGSYSPPPAIPWWWTTVCPLHHSPPVSTATKWRSTLVAISGSRATAIAIGSASSNPPSHSLRTTLWMSTQNSARGCPHLAARPTPRV